MCFEIAQVYLRSAASRVYKGHLQNERVIKPFRKHPKSSKSVCIKSSLQCMHNLHPFYRNSKISIIVNGVLKSRFRIISVSGFRKRKKQRRNMARCSSPENYYSSGRNTVQGRAETLQTLIYISARKPAN